MKTYFLIAFHLFVNLFVSFYFKINLNDLTLGTNCILLTLVKW